MGQYVGSAKSLDPEFDEFMETNAHGNIDYLVNEKRKRIKPVLLSPSFTSFAGTWLRMCWLSKKDDSVRE